MQQILKFKFNASSTAKVRLKCAEYIFVDHSDNGKNQVGKILVESIEAVKRGGGKGRRGEKGGKEKYSRQRVGLRGKAYYALLPANIVGEVMHAFCLKKKLQYFRSFHDLLLLSVYSTARH